MIELVAGLVILNLVLILVIRYYYLRYKSAVSGRMSQSSIYGKTLEQLMPFMKGFPFPPERFKFLGNPIDGVAFLDDKVVFVELKFNKSQLSPVQRRIRDAVMNGRVEWKTIQTRV